MLPRLRAERAQSKQITRYNKVDGVYCSEHKYLIENILRLTWGYQGLTVSDWFGTKSGVKALRAGLDLEMPFPIHRGKKLTEDIKSGLMGEAELETSVRRLITLREQVTAPQADAKPTHPSTQEPVDLARDLILEGAVLLQNRKTTLPLDLLQTPNIAVFGEYAASPVIAGGGSVAAEPQYRHSFLDVLRKTHPQQDKLQYYPCVRTRVLIPLAPTEKLTSKDGNPGVDVAFFNNDSTVPFHTDYQSTPNVHMFGKYIPGLDLSGSRVEIVTSLTPATSGEHTLAVRVTGSFTLAINNKEVLSGAAPDMRPEDFLFCPSLLERRVQVSMKANEPCAVRLVMQSRPMMVNEPTPFGAALCFEEYLDENAAVEAAANVARDADVAIIFAGRDGQYESEGFDLLSLRLPPNQESMIRTIGASARRTVLVLHCGNPIDVSPFVDSVDAVINAHFMGQEGARGLVDLILGKVNPSGRLATTWFQTLEDYPSFSHFPPKKLADGSVAVQYSEGLKVGYRSPETEQRVRWPFGHGLSYTTFAYAEPRVSLLGSKLLCSVSVKNIGSVIGKEVVQLYITPPASCSVWRPHRELKAFKKVQVEAGQSCSVELNLDLLTSCSYWDEGLVAWRMEAGTYGVHIGSCTSHFEVSEEQIWNHL
jgi:beta-glucosidase